MGCEAESPPKTRTPAIAKRTHDYDYDYHDYDYDYHDYVAERCGLTAT